MPDSTFPNAGSQGTLKSEGLNRRSLALTILKLLKPVVRKTIHPTAVPPASTMYMHARPSVHAFSVARVGTLQLDISYGNKGSGMFPMKIRSPP